MMDEYDDEHMESMGRMGTYNFFYHIFIFIKVVMIFLEIKRTFL